MVQGSKAKLQMTEQDAWLSKVKLTYVVSLTLVTMSLHLPSNPAYTAGALFEGFDQLLQSLQSSR
jgi:hypothetical protein